MAVGGGRLQHPLGAHGEGVRQFGDPFGCRAPDHARVGRRGREEGDGAGLVEQPAAVVAEDGDGGRVDDPVAVEGVAVGAVVLVELAGPEQAGVQRGGPAQGLLLRLRAVQVAAPRVAGGGEVQGGHVAAEPAGGLEGALAGDLEDRRHRGGGRDRDGARAVRARGLAGRRDGRRERDLPAVRGAVRARRDDPLGLLCDGAQARAHGATPVRALDARRASSPSCSCTHPE